MKKYEYVPASIDSLPRGLTLGVRFRKRRDTSIPLKRVDNLIKMEIPDRTIYLIRQSFDGGPERFPELDVVVDLDYFRNKSLLKAAGYGFGMVNAFAIPKKYYRDYDYENDETWAHIIADSGGFQLSTGVADFLDPVEVIKTHNSVCSHGIALDIPFPVLSREDVPLLQRAAAIQNKNTRVFLKHKRESLHLMNVFHGPNLYLLDKYRESVEQEDLNRVALGGVVRADLNTLILRLLHMITSGKKYRQYHALGVSGVERWVLLSYLAHRVDVPLITSDSTTYIKHGFNLEVNDPNRLCYGLDLRGRHNTVLERQQRLNCNCPVCSALGVTYPYTTPENKLSSALMVVHNLFVYRNYINTIWELTSPGVSHKEIITYLTGHVTNKSKLQTISQALIAVDTALDKSVVTACKKYSPGLLEKDPGSLYPVGLFHNVTESPKRKAARARIREVLGDYETYYQTGKKPERKLK